MVLRTGSRFSAKNMTFLSLKNIKNPRDRQNQDTPLQRTPAVGNL